jgi:hypothetical protein
MAEEIVTSPAPSLPLAFQPVTAQMPPDMGARYVNAFAMGVQMNLQRQQVEQQLARLGLAQKEFEFRQEWAPKEFQLQEDQLNALNQYRNAEIGVRSDAIRASSEWHRQDLESLDQWRQFEEKVKAGDQNRFNQIWNDPDSPISIPGGLH